ncbi:cation efflux family-domain-containing protein [Annulohypoxylon maeteangense]|uniref:cation efflux family-domain-containing protein n=1 Tax=Annulohypoxylon maeteangense TaxID=1927788 RepID=UPI0020073F6A|nr:cation efflux family-domain-containing protein [Annulohypoxylon maeteangense]KAI0885278.1 cation efflux family-domain-containing protein [Annulohypoxylon maeteangense]
MAPTSTTRLQPPPPISVTPTIQTPDDFDDPDIDIAIDLDEAGPNPNYFGYGQSNLLSPNRDAFYDPNRLSPVAPTFQGHDFLSPNMASSSGGFSENSSPIDIPNASNGNAPNPFNFQTQIISTSPVKPNVGQRRGHKYKHSSISAQHQIFQEPPPRPPLALPRDLPVPTVREAWKSMSKDQRRRLYWCMCHLLIAVSVFLTAHGSLAMTALSHLVLFDVGSALICVAVEVLGNFEVWKRSSIRHPFGLERAEVLAGFALSIFLIFGGFDLVSHNLKHVLEGKGGHAPHHPDPHDGGEPRVPAGGVDMASLAAIAASLVSAYGLRNHARISKVMRVSYLASLPSVLSNPFHFMTLSTSALMVLLPLLSIPIGMLLDSAICGIVAIAMFALGTRLAIAQGLMLLMSYGGRSGTTTTSSSPNISGSGIGGGGKNRDVGVADVVREIEAELGVEKVEEAQFWQVHYGLCMANLKLSVSKGADDAALSRLRARVSNLIQNRLGEGYGKGGSLRWEVSLQMGTVGRF